MRISCIKKASKTFLAVQTKGWNSSRKSGCVCNSVLMIDTILALSVGTKLWNLSIIAEVLMERENNWELSWDSWYSSNWSANVPVSWCIKVIHRNNVVKWFDTIQNLTFFILPYFSVRLVRLLDYNNVE